MELHRITNVITGIVATHAKWAPEGEWVRITGPVSPSSPIRDPGPLRGLVCELVQTGRFTWSEPAPGNRSGGSVLLPSPVGIRHRCDDRIRTVVVPND
ncbi:hypothetical protein AB0N62_34740 [Streptomyces sp. NPDC093982]|uniref:hypothetical protein n=1 Tax=Streptomyces sp. NPDC093982 TaxID=3155077 RepID=UPI003428DD23